jgi:hypothetical protein
MKLTNLAWIVSAIMWAIMIYLMFIGYILPDSPEWWTSKT